MRKKARSSKDKGDIVERIVERFYRDRDVNVQRDVRLPARWSPGMRTRQIDVLITRPVAGLPVRIAIECKNVAKPVDVKAVDAFRSALDDVGIPPQYGIMVSASGYTEGAFERAQKEQLQLQILDGLTSDRIASKVGEATQLIVYVALEILEMHSDSRLFYDAEGKFAGMLDDLVWRKWVAGEIGTTLGERDVELCIPEDWIYGVDGAEFGARTGIAKVSVLGIVISLPGRTESHALTTLAVQSQYKQQTRVYYDEPKGPQPVRIARTEKELEALVVEPPVVKAQMGRLPFPRIRTFVGDPLSSSTTLWCYWPPSERVHSLLNDRARASAAGESLEPPELTSEHLEGTSLNSVFDPIARHYPAARISTIQQSDSDS